MIEDARSTPYASDIGKAFQAPVFHVNADSPDDVSRVFRIAAEYRTQFQSDVIIDLIGYRKFGHNELDQPFVHSTHNVQQDKVSSLVS